MCLASSLTKLSRVAVEFRFFDSFLLSLTPILGVPVRRPRSGPISSVRWDRVSGPLHGSSMASQSRGRSWK